MPITSSSKILESRSIKTCLTCLACFSSVSDHHRVSRQEKVGQKPENPGPTYNLCTNSNHHHSPAGIDWRRETGPGQDLLRIRTICSRFFENPESSGRQFLSAMRSGPESGGPFCGFFLKNPVNPAGQLGRPDYWTKKNPELESKWNPVKVPKIKKLFWNPESWHFHFAGLNPGKVLQQRSISLLPNCPVAHPPSHAHS